MSLIVHKWTENIFQLQDAYGYCAALVIGHSRALLFDTMSGTGNFLGTIREITELPLIVVNSHGHLDHTAGNIYFEQVYMHPADWTLITKYHHHLPGLPEELKSVHDRLVEWATVDGSIRPILPGVEIDLGGVMLDVVSLAGHTQGSIGLYCPQERLLLSGDALSPQMCLFFPESLPIARYLETVEFALGLGAKHFITGHHVKLMPIEFLHYFSKCAKLAQAGEKSVPYAYPIAPNLTGYAYFLDYYNEDIEGPICFIGKDRNEN